MNDGNEQRATDLCAALNLTLGWRASEPERGLRGYTGNVVLHARAADEIVRRIDGPGMSVWTPIVPGIAMAGLDVFIALIDREVDEGARLAAEDVPHPCNLPGLPAPGRPQ